MLCAITKNNEVRFTSIEPETSFSLGKYDFHFYQGIGSINSFSNHGASPKSFWYVSNPVFIRETTGLREVNCAETPISSITQKVENNFVGFEITTSRGDWIAYVCSGRINRQRMFYLILDYGILFSDDLRNLIPYSKKKINPIGGFSILKYGDVPESITVVEGIYSVPVGQHINFQEESLDRWIDSMIIPKNDFSFFFNLDFPMTGGDLLETESLLENEFDFIANLNPLVPISGGVDSALANCMIDKHRTTSYPGYFIQFGEKDTELQFARQAIKNTKIDLEVTVFTSKDTIPSFEFQTARAIQPIGESSTISTAHFLMNTDFKGYQIIDGSLADACYGSTNYNKNIIAELPNRSRSEQRFNEYLAMQLQYHRLPGQDRFFPRDSLVSDPYLQFRNVYLGPFANTWLKGASEYSAELTKLWQFYYEYVKDDFAKQDHWTRYSSFKIVPYSKITTAKTQDIPLPDNMGLYPFTWLSVLKDQGKYSWKEKSKGDVVKYPLKKILEKYMPKEFVHRKKMGLNSKFEDWIFIPYIKDYFLGILQKPSGAAQFYLGNRQKLLVNQYSKSKILHGNVARLIINVCMLDAWMEHNGVDFS